ncbi:hypothetical protein [Thermocatellispora tengchongensis]|uniref:hypothetical protein n=1 Tax=Thermocatellispora tengchongensis TaxID=1073253 RepID=UPI00363DF781
MTRPAPGAVHGRRQGDGPASAYRQQWRRHRHERGPRPVIDPSLDADVAWTLRASPGALRAARAHAGARHPAHTGRGGHGNGHGNTAHPMREAARRARRNHHVDPFTVFSVVAFLALVAGTTGVGGAVLALVIIGSIGAVRQATRDLGNQGARRKLRLAMEHGDRFVLPEDLDHACQELLRRTQDAVDSVLASRVNQAGLIDTIDNRVTLPEETWRVAVQLARLSAMNAEHHRIVPRDLPAEVASAFAPYTAALDAAFESLSARVRALEDYAWRVYRADQVYRAFRQLEVLAERTPEYEQLLADVVRDELAAPHIEHLSDQAEQVRALFRQSIDVAREAGAHLLAGGLTPATPDVPAPPAPRATPGPPAAPEPRDA